MNFALHEKIQLGETGLIFRDLSNLISGSIEVDIYVCPKCKKLEFFHTESKNNNEEPLPKRICPECGDEHDFDYPRCPRCKYDYYKKG